MLPSAMYSSLPSGVVVAIFGDVCTYGILYSVGQLPDRAMYRAAYKKPKVHKITEITELCHL